MRRALWFSLVLATTLPAQYRGRFPNGGAAGGFGNVVYPGTGGPPPPTVHTGNVINPGVAFRPGVAPIGRVNNVNNGLYRPVYPNHNNTVVVPYAVPVYVGSYAGYYDPSVYAAQQAAPAPLQQQAAPPVIINQNFIPDTAGNAVVHEYNQPPEPPRPPLRTYDAPLPPTIQPTPSAAQAVQQDDRPTVYLIAFKDGRVQSTVAYWVEGKTVSYVTSKGAVNQATLDFIDRDLSAQLNRERHVEFSLE